MNAIRQAIRKAQENTDQPTLIEVKTVIGYGSPNKSGSSASHGAPLGKNEVQQTKEFYGWDYPAFEIPEEVYADFRSKIAEPGLTAEKEWNHMFDTYKNLSS